MSSKSVRKTADGETVEQLNAYIPSALKRRMMMARVNTGRPMTALLIEWIEKGLTEVEKPAKGSKRGVDAATIEQRKGNR